MDCVARGSLHGSWDSGSVVTDTLGHPLTLCPVLDRAYRSMIRLLLVIGIAGSMDHAASRVRFIACSAFSVSPR